MHLVSPEQTNKQIKIK